MDKIKPLKIENIIEGSQDDQGYPTECNPVQDYVECAGVCFQGLSTHYIDTASNQIRFVDPVNGTVSLSQLKAGYTHTHVMADITNLVIDAQFIKGVPVDPFTDTSASTYNLIFNRLTNKIQISPNIPAPVSILPPSNPSNGQTWIPANVPMQTNIWDAANSVWVSNWRDTLVFTRGGNVDGSNLSIGGWLGTDFYWSKIGGAVIYAIYCNALSGNTSKILQITQDDVLVYQFQFNGTLTYENNLLNVKINPRKKIRCYVSDIGGSVSDITCQIELGWIYG